MIKKSAISLISYDAHYLPKSIERYYDYVDEIVLGLDKNRISWSGNKFSFNESKLWSELNTVDVDNKIVIVEENFHQNSVAIENDNYERNFLKQECSHDWVLSIDADEYLLNAKEFFNDFCPLIENYRDKLDICMVWATPYKIIGDKVLVIANEDDTPFFGENQGVLTHAKNTYTYARWTSLSAAGGNRLVSPLVALHWSLCRDEKGLKEKLANHGHSDVYKTHPFYNNWLNITLDNYKELKNFKTTGIGPAQWPKLYELPLADIESYYKSHLAGAY